MFQYQFPPQYPFPLIDVPSLFSMLHGRHHSLSPKIPSPPLCVYNTVIDRLLCISLYLLHTSTCSPGSTSFCCYSLNSVKIPFKDNRN